MKKKKLALAIVILAGRCYGIKCESISKVLNRGKSAAEGAKGGSRTARRDKNCAAETGGADVCGKKQLTSARPSHRRLPAAS